MPGKSICAADGARFGVVCAPKEDSMSSSGEMHRRSFLVGASVAGGGLALGFAIPRGTDFEHPPTRLAEVNCWVTIAPDDMVTIRIARAEMGQGAMTGLAMLVAEELECDWKKVHTRFVSPVENLRRGRTWGDLSTGASRSIASSQDYLRRAGAIAREMLIAAAAARWGVPVTQCRAQNSKITDLKSRRTLRFGDVARDAAKIKPPENVALKKPAGWKLVGTPRNRL